MKQHHTIPHFWQLTAVPLPFSQESALCAPFPFQPPQTTSWTQSKTASLLQVLAPGSKNILWGFHPGNTSRTILLTLCCLKMLQTAQQLNSLPILDRKVYGLSKGYFQTSCWSNYLFYNYGFYTSTDKLQSVTLSTVKSYDADSLSMEVTFQ